VFHLRHFQKQTLESLNKPCHIICVAPTGSGKSLIYELKSLQADTRTVLITPLIALSRQQEESLKMHGISVSRSTGGNTRCPPDGNGIWILSPEALQYDSYKRKLKLWRPNFLVVDECHCFWDWAEEFRPAFKNLPSLIGEYQIPQSLWLTATLPVEARKVLKEQLPAPIKEIGEYELPHNLSLNIIRASWVERIDYVLGFIQNKMAPGIVFTFTREQTKRLSKLFISSGKRVLFYHAGMSQEERNIIEKDIKTKAVDVVVATSAFGMGMDYDHLRWALLWQAPPSLLTLAQMIGRVGRGGKSGEALVFWDNSDFRTLEWMVKGSRQRRRDFIDTYNFLNSNICRRQGLKFYFEGTNSTFNENCSSCDVCVRHKYDDIANA